MEFDFEDKIEQIAKIPKIVRVIVVLVLVAGMGAGYYFTSYKDSQEKVKQLRSQAQQLQRQLNKVRIVATNVAEFEQEVADLQRQLDQALSQLPDRKQFEDLLRDISISGKRAGVTIKSIDRNTEVRHDFYAEVPFTLELQGTYHDVARFFERVSRLPRIVNIGTIAISVKSETRRETILTVVGKATTFRFLRSDGHAAAAKTPRSGSEA
jgi:type IV pilus assembly protein PilO